MKRFLPLAVSLALASAGLTAQEMSLRIEDYPKGSVIGDAALGAPELAERGARKVGVRTILLVNPRQPDVINSVKGKPAILYDRELSVELWYPAVLEGRPELCAYVDHLGRADQSGTLKPFTFAGRAARDAVPDRTGGPYPLIILSHGYPGSRYLMSNVGENLASKGYVVAAIGHTDSTYEDVKAFSSTLVNRSVDQRFVLDRLLSLSVRDAFWKGLFDKDKVGLIGYSMGGYGALRTLGAGCNERVQGMAGDFFPSIQATDKDSPDRRFKAAVLIAPWGGAFGGSPTGLWNPDSLGKITAPTLWIAGSQDDVAGYAGIASLFEASVHSDRHLLTYVNALHNVVPNPAPPEAENWGQASRWEDPVWDTRRVNSVNHHFITAFFDFRLKGKTEAGAYLDVPVEDSNAGVFAVNKDGTKAATHTYWPGFAARTAVGLRLRSIPAK